VIPGNENKVIPVSMVVYWMMISWLKQSDTLKLKQSDTLKLKQSDTCVNGGLLNDDTLIKTKWYLEIKTKWYLCQWWFIEWLYLDWNKVIPVSMVVYWMMILWLKESDTWKLKQSDTCINSGLLNDYTSVKRKWYLCQWWFIEWWYLD
jgi:hypothetical protein